MMEKVRWKMSIKINEVLKEVKKLRISVAVSLNAIEYITQQDLEHILGQVTAIENYLEEKENVNN